MKHISIEGMDGVGKSTTCNLLAKRLGYKFIEKPLHFIFDKDAESYDEYLRIRDWFNANQNRNLSSLFYGLGSLYMYDRFKDENVVTDRHLASNYAWSGKDYNEDVYDLLVKKLGKPQLTVILYSPSNTIIKRLISRSKTDSDISKAKISESIYEKMIIFCKKYSFPYIVIDTSNLTPSQVVDKIVEAL